MFGVSSLELLLIFIIGLLILGPERLPRVARRAGDVLVTGGAAALTVSMRRLAYD